MKNIFYCSNTQNDIFPTNTRTSFDSYIDVNDLNYIPNKYLHAALKSITFDNRCNTITLNPEKPDIIIKQTDAAWSIENINRTSKRKGPPLFGFGHDHIFINDMNENNDIYIQNECKNFTDIKIVEHTHDKNGQMKVLHNIYLNDVILHSATHLINYLNEIFEKIYYPYVLGPHSYSRKIFVNNVLERHDFDIFFSEKIGAMLGMEKTLVPLHKYSTLRELADMHLPVMKSWTQGEVINESLNEILDRRGEYIYYLVWNANKKKINIPPRIKLKTNFNIFKPDILGVRSTISDFSIKNNTYDRIIAYIDAKDLKNDVIHLTFNNPIFHDTTKEKLSQAHFELVDINTNQPPSTLSGTPTYIQVAIKSQFMMKQTFSVFLDSSDNASKKIYPTNSNMNFTTKLPERMEFRRNWEISMQTLFIPSKLNNIFEDLCWFQTVKVKEKDIASFRRNNQPIFKIEKYKVVKHFKIKSGYYPTPWALQECMQNALKNFTITAIDGKFMIASWQKKKSKQLLVLSPYLSQLLGFGTGELTFLDFHHQDEIGSIYEPDIFLLTPRNLIVMCNIADDTIFGGQHLRLLKLVANNERETTSDLHSFDFLHHEFVQLGVKDFDAISICIVDTTGREVETDSTIPTRLQIVFKTA